MDKTKFIEEANAHLVNMAPHVEARLTSRMLHEATDEIARKCYWEFNKFKYYETGCNRTHVFNEGKITDMFFKHCPYCGGVIET